MKGHAQRIISDKFRIFPDMLYLQQFLSCVLLGSAVLLKSLDVGINIFILCSKLFSTLLFCLFFLFLFCLFDPFFLFFLLLLLLLLLFFQMSYC